MIYQNPQYCMGNRSAGEKFMVALSILRNPWMLLLDKLGLVKLPLYQTRANGERASVQFQSRGGTTDINDAVVVLSGKEYPPELLGLANKGADLTVLDCGGHIGTFTMYLKSLYPQAKVLVMEPVPDNLALLQQNIGRNNLTDVTIIPFALYGQSGTFYIDLAGKQFDAVHVTAEKPTHDQFVTIEAKALDEVLAENGTEKIDLMKLDIEGAEYHIFAHSLSALATRVGRIIMEFHPAGDTAKRNEIVERLCTDGPFKLIYETKNILGFENSALKNSVDETITSI
jgi:FkbM family methyltransferase